MYDMLGLAHDINVLFQWQGVFSKIQVPSVFETQKPGNKTSSREIGLNIRTPASPKAD